MYNVASHLKLVSIFLWDVKLKKFLKPQDSFGRFVNFFLDLQKVDPTIKKHH